MVLVIGGELLVQNASALALKAKISPLVVGLTVVAMGTSAPELFASLQAAWKGDGSIAIGNVLGSNVANLGLALGLTALVSPVAMKWRDLKLHWWVMLAATAAFMVFVQDLKLTRQEGLMLLAGGALYLGGQILAARRDAKFVASALSVGSKSTGSTCPAISSARHKTLLIKILKSDLCCATSQQMAIPSNTPSG